MTATYIQIQDALIAAAPGVYNYGPGGAIEVTKHEDGNVSCPQIAAVNAEVGLFTTPLAAGNGNQTLTKVEAGATGAINVLGELRNSSAFTTSFAVGAHCWIGFRADSTVAPEPNMRSIVGRFQRRYVLTTAAAGALTSSATFAGVVPAFSTGSVGVHLIGSKL